MFLVKIDYLGQLKYLINFSYLILLFFLFVKLLNFFDKFILAILKYCEFIYKYI